MPDRVEVRAVRNGGVDHIEVPTAEETLIAALRRERAGYVQRNLPDRVAAVDAELSRLGVDPAPPAGPTTPPKGAGDGGEPRGAGRAARKSAGRRAAAERQ
ncbi:hypothetical protein O7622_01205 [Micromonospora sp. WMMD1076]|uniref:hypothetical protein n=1 Tax=Micromonospora sp. WMMD1076 TaxID=3016103 RepID=UPI00249C9212|nr:hypothetical protein [Micromonospora sp. WMMD1076]WFF07248.1 hypothetical protein O7622_01205 [Micromonospora sp. WMMD1076]